MSLTDVSHFQSVSSPHPRLAKRKSNANTQINLIFPISRSLLEQQHSYYFVLSNDFKNKRIRLNLVGTMLGAAKKRGLPDSHADKELIVIDDDNDGDSIRLVDDDDDDDALTTQPLQESLHYDDGKDESTASSINPRGSPQGLVIHRDDESAAYAPPDKDDFTGRRVGEVVWTECTVTEQPATIDASRNENALQVVFENDTETRTVDGRWVRRHLVPAAAAASPCQVMAATTTTAQHDSSFSRTEASSVARALPFSNTSILHKGYRA